MIKDYIVIWPYSNVFSVFILIMNLILLPESLNGETGLVCSYLGKPNAFSGLKVYEILEGMKAAKELTSGVNFVNLDRLRIAPRMR
jgi:hypothetical protein